jgi:hypothetical protein
MTDIAYQTTTIGIAGKSALLSRFTAWCTHFLEGVREGQEIAARYHALSRLSTPELARRGFNRQMIARAALTGN